MRWFVERQGSLTLPGLIATVVILPTFDSSPWASCGLSRSGSRSGRSTSEVVGRFVRSLLHEHLHVG